VLHIIVGGAGAAGVAGASVNGGYNNTAAVGGWCNSSGLTIYGGGGGGGASEICMGGTALTNRIIVAGGGGGGGNNCANPGGDGGGLTGATAPNCSSEYSGTGGSQTDPGLGGTYSSYGTSADGGPRFGGAASTYPSATPGSAGGGGGGGYYGGGGGSWGGGGGGSSYSDPALATAVIHTPGYNTTGNGSVTLTLVCTATAGTITGNAPLCAGGLAMTLSDPSGATYGSWSSSNTAVADIGSATGMVLSGVPGTSTISYTVVTACGTTLATTVVTVNAIPAAGTITGAPNVCVGHTVTLSNSVSGGVWSSNNAAVSLVGSGTGVVTGVTAGTDTIFYTVTISGCSGVAAFPFEVLSPGACDNSVAMVNNAAVEMNVAPNPNNGKFVANVSSPVDEQVHFIIVNMVGEKVGEISGFTNRSVNINVDVPAGIYVLNATTSRGALTKQLMVVR